MSLKYMAKNLGLELAKQLKKISPIQVIVLILVLVFILYDTSIPTDVEDFIREPFGKFVLLVICLLYTSPSPRDATLSRMPSSA